MLKLKITFTSLPSTQPSHTHLSHPMSTINHTRWLARPLKVAGVGLMASAFLGALVSLAGRPIPSESVTMLHGEVPEPQWWLSP